MNQTRWLRHVESTLLKAGLPALYVDRTCLELSDHIEASLSAGEESSLLMESPSDLSSQLVCSYRKQGLWRRIPPVVLLLLPLPVTIMMTLVYYQLCWVALVILFQPDGGPSEIPLHVVTTMWAFFYSGKLAAPLLSGMAARGIARRMARPWGWAAALFALQSFVIALTVTSLELTPADANLDLSLVFEWPHLMGAAQLFSALAMAILGFWVVMRLRFEQQRVMA